MTCLKNMLVFWLGVRDHGTVYPITCCGQEHTYCQQYMNLWDKKESVPCCPLLQILLERHFESKDGTRVKAPTTNILDMHGDQRLRNLYLPVGTLPGPKKPKDVWLVLPIVRLCEKLIAMGQV